jgi:arylsulfatase A-like enzyme/tetratricopeptide (TPR) repeat protein
MGRIVPRRPSRTQPSPARKAPIAGVKGTPAPKTAPAPRPGLPWRLWAGGLALVVALSAGVWWWGRGPTFTLPPPTGNQNVVLVTIDTLRADMLSSYGGPVPTPNLDALASHGARFTFAHSHAVVTLVSHTTILSGELPYETGVRDNSGFRVAPGTPTLATRLKAAGFATGAFVGGYPLTKRFGLTPGFDVYDDQMPETRGIGAFALPERRAEEVVSRAVTWIGEQRSPFFGWVHVFDPHAPYSPPAKYLARFREQPYYGEIAYVDHALGALFASLAAQSRPTLVIVTADHGESLGEHGEATHGMFAYEATLHIPLIVATVVPGKADSGTGVVIDAPAAHIDIVPTVLEAVGLPVDPALKGTSLRDEIRTDRRANAKSYFEAMTFNLTRGWAPLRGVLADRTKFIDLPIPELYDLTPDPKEASNLAETEPNRLPTFHDDLTKFNVAAPNQPVSEDADAIAKLQSLGYMSTRAMARSTYTRADDPKTLLPVDLAVHKAQDLYEKGQAAEAIAQLSGVLAAHPALGDVAVYLAYAQWETGQPQVAIATLESAFRNHATDANVQIRLGLYLAESHTDITRAITILEALPKTNVEALNALGVAYDDAGRLGDAIATFRRLLVLDPTNGLALNNIGTILMKEAQAETDPARKRAAWQVAEATVQQAIKADPTLADAYNSLGVIMRSTGRPADAIKNWKEAARQDPRNFDALENLVITLSETGQLADARTYARQYVNTAPSDRYAKTIAEMRRFLGG